MQHAIPSCCQREAQRLYRPWLQAVDAAGNNTEPQSRDDRNLHAIAQLASLRLGTQRAIIFLIDDKSQHILAEVTQTLPSSYESSAEHELVLGVSSLLRSGQHIQAHTTRHPGLNDPSKPSHFFSTDCRSDNRFKDLGVVEQEDGVQFAAGVPLLRNNCTIGALVVLDGSPRDGVEDTDFLELKEYAQCVVRHLELVRSSTGPRRETAVLREIARCFADQYQDPLGGEKTEESADAECDTEEEDPSNAELDHENFADLEEHSNSIEASLQATFDGAAKVLRDCSLADGTVIFGPPAVASLMVIDEKTSPPEPDHNDSDDLPSIVLASCSRDEVAFTAHKYQRAPSVGTLNRLASVYPRGMVFDVAGDTVSTLQSTDRDRRFSAIATAPGYVVGDLHGIEEVLTMLRADIVSRLTEAQTLLIFLPVYDQENKSLLASCFAWYGSDVEKGIGHRDVSDYHVLGNFLSHSVAQLMLQNKSSEQKKFMSNFSHELRTPINGILGSAQFLQDTVSDDYQNELLQSIVVSSNTLLDTVSLSHFHPVSQSSHKQCQALVHVPSEANVADTAIKRAS
jgi:GAF domain-containing protein